jgi:hypothetical protein
LEISQSYWPDLSRSLFNCCPTFSFKSVIFDVYKALVIDYYGGNLKRTWKCQNPRRKKNDGLILSHVIPKKYCPNIPQMGIFLL